MKLKLFSLMITIVFFNHQISFAQEKSQHLEAAKCSAGFFVLTSISEKEPSLGQYFEKQKVFSDSVAHSFYKSKIDRRITRDDEKLLNDYGLIWIEEFYSSSSNFIPQFVSDCISWNFSIHKTLGVEQVNVSINSNLIPKHKALAKYPHTNFVELVPFIQDAFSIWIRNGKPQSSDALTLGENFNPLDCIFGDSEIKKIPKRCEITPLDEAKVHCGNEHFTPYFKSEQDKENYLSKYRYVRMGFVEGSDNYANCVISIIDFFVSDEAKDYERDEAINYIPSNELVNAGINCSEIGFKVNTPKFGKCVLKLLD